MGQQGVRCQDSDGKTEFRFTCVECCQNSATLEMMTFCASALVFSAASTGLYLQHRSEHITQQSQNRSIQL